MNTTTLQSSNRGNPVPMIRRANAYGVQIISLAKLAEVFIADTIFVAGSVTNFLQGCGLLLGIDITNSDDLYVLEAQERDHVVTPLAACADKAHGNPITRRHAPTETE